MPTKKAATTARKKTAATKRHAAAPRPTAARPVRKKVSVGSAVRAVGTFAARGAEKIRQTVARSRNLTAATDMAKSAGREALTAGLNAAVAVIAERIVGRRR